MRTRFVVPMAGAAIALLSTLSGCAPTVALQPAPDANDPACAAVEVRLPDTVAGEERRTTNAQSTGAWGDPAGIILRCGFADSGPSALPCVTVDDIDWLRDASADPVFTFTTFGRTPAVQVTIDSRHAAGTTALSDLSAAVGTIPATARCLDATDPLSN